MVRSVTGWLVVVIGASVLVVYAVSFPLNHDVGWWLYVAEAMLAGEPLYTSLVEVNPPLFGYFCMLPVLLAGTTGTPVEFIVELLMFALIGLVVIWVVRLARLASVAPSFAPLLAGSLVAGLIGLPGIDLGQREHLMLILTAPYVVLLWLRSLGHEVTTGEAMLIGSAAAAGFALKPHFVVIFLSLELWFAYRIRHRSMASLIRPESLTIVGLGTLYIFFVIALHPEFFSLLWEARELYGRFNPQPRGELIANGYLVLLAAAAFLLWDRSDPGTRLAEFALVFATATFVIMVLQGKGWSYHLYPISSWMAVCSALLFWRAMRRRDWSLQPASIGTMAMLMLLGLGFVSVTVTRVGRHTSERDRREAQLAYQTAFFKDARPGSRMLMLSDRLEEGFPLVQRADLDWVAPFPSLWWIRATYDRREGEDEGSLQVPRASTTLEREYLRRLMRRVRVHEPKYVLVDVSPRAWFDNRPFPYFEYLERSLGSGGLLDEYGRQGVLGHFEVWQRE